MRDNKKGQFPTDRRNDRGGKDGKAAGGSRDTLSSAFIRALHADWSEHGPSVIEQIRKEQPGAYIKTVACLLSKQADVSQDALDTLTDEELDELIASLRHALGVPHQADDDEPDFAAP